MHNEVKRSESNFCINEIFLIQMIEDDRQKYSCDWMSKSHNWTNQNKEMSLWNCVFALWKGETEINLMCPGTIPHMHFDSFTPNEAYAMISTGSSKTIIIWLIFYFLNLYVKRKIQSEWNWSNADVIIELDERLSQNRVTTEFRHKILYVSEIVGHSQFPMFILIR